MKALITGGAGFIGYHLTKELLDNNYEVTITDSFDRGVKDSFFVNLKKYGKVEFITLDLLDKNKINLLKNNYDYIFHLAAIIGVQNVLNKPYDVLEKNVELLINVLELARRQNQLKRFVFASTSEVYAGTLKNFGIKIPTPEVTPLTVMELENPRTSYMLSKIYGEAMIIHSKIPYTIIRPHNFYGPRMGLSHVIPELLKKAHFNSNNNKIEVFSVEHKRTFCFINDAVKMIRLLTENDGSYNEVFNVGCQELEISMKELAEIILNIMGVKLKIEEKPPTTGSPERRCPDMTRLFNVTKYKCQFPLEQGIKKTYDWYLENIFSGKEPSAK